MGSASRSLSGNQAKKVVFNGSPSEYVGPQSAKPGLFSAGEPASAFEGSTGVVAGTVLRRWNGNGGGRRWGPGVQSFSGAVSLKEVSVPVHPGETDSGGFLLESSAGALLRRQSLAVRSSFFLLRRKSLAVRSSFLRRRMIWAVRSFVVLPLGLLDLMLVVWAVLVMMWMVEYVIQLVSLSELAVLVPRWMEWGIGRDDTMLWTRHLVVQLALDAVRCADFGERAVSALRRVLQTVLKTRFSLVVLRVHRHGSHVSPLHSIICVLFTALLSLHMIHTRACLMHDVW